MSFVSIFTLNFYLLLNDLVAKLDLDQPLIIKIITPNLKCK